MKKITDPLTWVTEATEKPSKDKRKRKAQRQALLTAHVKGNVTFGLDGHRVHLVNDVLPIGDEIKPVDVALQVVSRAKSGTIMGRISKYHLLKAAEVCGVFAKHSMNIMKMTLNGTWSCTSASAEFGSTNVTIENGDSWYVKWVFAKSPAEYRRIVKTLGCTENYDNALITSKVVYDHTGADICIAVDYKYLIEALEGLPEIIEYRMTDPDTAFYLAGEVDGVLREAVIMPIHLGND